MTFNYLIPHGFIYLSAKLLLLLIIIITILCFSFGQYSETAVAPRKSILKAEVEWLNSIKADLVVLHFNPSFIFSSIHYIILILKSEDPHLTSFTQKSEHLFVMDRFLMLFQLHVVLPLMLEFALFVSPTLGNFYYCHLSFMLFLLAFLISSPFLNSFLSPAF